MTDAMAMAERAVRWAKRPICYGSHDTNYERLRELIVSLVRDSGEPTSTSNGGFWPCLSRLLIMDNPKLAPYLHVPPSVELDSQAGTTWLQLQFADVIGDRPTVRSWRHAIEGMRQ